MKKLEIKVLSIRSNKGFSLLAGINRNVIPSHVTKMAASVEKMGIIRPVVVAKISFITGVEETYVIDGTHLYHCSLRLGIDIPYVEIDVKDKEDLVVKIAMLNNSSKSWTMRDYIQAWSSLHPDYVKLNHYGNVYDVELLQIAEILMDGTCSHNVGGFGSYSRVIKKGEFVIEDERRGVQTLDYITDALKIVPRLDRMSNKMFIASYVGIMNNTQSYDHKQFLSNLKVHKDKFKLATQDPEEYKKLFKTLL